MTTSLPNITPDQIQSLFGANAPETRTELAEIFIQSFRNQTTIGDMAAAMGNGISPAVVGMNRRPNVDKSETVKEITTDKRGGFLLGSLVGLGGPLLTAAGLWLGGAFDKPTPVSPPETKPIVKTVTEPGKTVNKNYRLESDVIPKQ